MSPWRFDRLSIGIDGRRVAWTASSLAAGSAEWSATAGGLDEAIAEALATPRQAPWRRVSVTLADELAKYWLMAPPPNARSLGDLRAVARVRCQQLFGDAEGGWEIVADWQTSGRFPCAAVPRPVLAAARRAAPRVRTLLSTLLEDAADRFPRDGWACITSPSTTTVLGTSRGRVTSLRTLPGGTAFGGVADTLARAAGELRRESVRQSLPVDGTVAWLDAGPVDEATSSPRQVEELSFQPVAWPSVPVDLAACGEAGLAAFIGQAPGRSA